jgi:hypothetical protein
LGGLAHQLSNDFMKEIMYDHNSVLIVSALFVCMLLAMEIGFRSGRRKQACATEAITQANAVLAAMLGLLALLLAFTFSAALQRYENRSQTVVAEANAIGTTYLRAQLLPKGMPDEVQALLRQYLGVRIQDGRVDATETCAPGMARYFVGESPMARFCRAEGKEKGKGVAARRGLKEAQSETAGR